MARISKRPMASMFKGAMEAQEGETIAQLKEELESLKSMSSQSFKLSVEDIQPLQLPGKLKQPRLYFDPQKMERLRDSIEKHGVLEPILVRPGREGTYEIISGERRWRCCKALELEDIPAIVRDMPDSMALEAALIAHLLNEEISTIEQTESILSLLSLHLDIPIEDVKTGLYQTNNAQIRGTENSRIFSEEQLSLISEILSEFGMKLSSFVSNRLPMLNLSPAILEAVREGKLSPTNAVLINRQDADFHEELVEQSQGLTKRDVMALVKEFDQPDTTAKQAKTSVSDQIFARFKTIRRKKKLMGSDEVQKKLTEIDKLLQEIEAMAN